MSLYSRFTSNVVGLLLRVVPDMQLYRESKQRFGQAPHAGQATSGIVPDYIPQVRISLEEWTGAINAARNPSVLNRANLYVIYENVMLDLQLTGAVQKMVLHAQQTRFKFVNAKGETDEEATKLTTKTWWEELVEYIVESRFYGHSLIELFDLKDYSQIALVPRTHVCPELGVWKRAAWDQPGAGISYLAEDVRLWYIEAGKPADLGLLAKITPVVLAKRWAQNSWSEFNERFGQPMRIGTMKGSDAKRELKLGEILDKMGAAGWAVIRENEKIEFLQQGQGDPHKVFLALMEYCDAQISKVILGGTLSMDTANNGNRSLGEVHQEAAEDIEQANVSKIIAIANDHLIPRLEMLKLIPAGLRLEQDTHRMPSVDEMIKVDTVIFQYFDVEPAVVEERYGYKPGSIKPKAAPVQLPSTQPPTGGRAGARGRVIDQHLDAHYADFNHAPTCPRCGTRAGAKHVHAQALDEDPLAGEIERILREMHRASTTGKEPAKFDAQLFRTTAARLHTGVTEGYGDPTIQYNAQDKVAMAFLRDNIQVFSGAKTRDELVRLRSFLTDAEGKTRSFNDFRRDALAVHESYNVRWLQAEYNAAVAGSQMCSRWQQIDQVKDTFSLLKYDAVNDSRTRPQHRMLDGITRPVDDAFWDTWYPPNDYGCRCSVVQLMPDEATETDVPNDMPAVNPVFGGNVGKTGTIYSDAHPYFERLKVGEGRDWLSAQIASVLEDNPYTRMYETPNGNYVDVHRDHNPAELEENLQAGRVLADSGFNIRLREYTYEADKASPDAEVERDGEWQIIDFKRPKGEATPEHFIRNNCKGFSEDDPRPAGLAFFLDFAEWDGAAVARKLKGEYKLREFLTHAILYDRNLVARLFTRDQIAAMESLSLE